MSIQVFASNAGTSLVLYKGFPKCKRSGNAWEITFRWWCQQALAQSLVPANGASCPLSDFGTLKCREVNIDPNDRPGFVDVTAVYRPSGSPGIGGHEDGDVTKEANLSHEEISIDDPRLVTSNYMTQAAVDGLKAAGTKSVQLGSVEYSYTTYDNNFEWTEANVIAGCGTIEAPTGLTSPTSGKWFALGARVRQTNDDLTEVSKTWKYSQIGWRT